MLAEIQFTARTIALGIVGLVFIAAIIAPGRVYAQEAEIVGGPWGYSLETMLKTDAGEVGKVVHISRMTVFVAIPVAGAEDRIEGFLESQLTRVDPPEAVH